MEASTIAARRTFLLVWSVLGLAKLVLIASLQPFGDEAFYWLEAQHPAWAYSDLPGATAWLIALGDSVGVGEVGLRWPFLVLGLLLPWQMVWMARAGGGEAQAWLAGSLACLMPLSALLGVLALPDVPLATASLLCLDAGRRLLRSGSPGVLMMLALGLALGAFSHYRFAAVPAALALGWLLAGALPRLLRTPGFWLAIAAGALAWLPLLWFNLAHAGAGFSFHLVERHPWRFHPEGWLQLPTQAAVVSPLLYIFLLLVLARAWRGWRTTRAAPDGWILGAGGATLLGWFVLGFFADTERVSFHWPLPGYLALLPALAAWLNASPRLRKAGLVLAGSFTLAAMSSLGASSLGASAWGGAAERVAASRYFPDNLVGWREVGHRVEQALAALPAGAVVVADNFMLAAQLAFHLRGSRAVYSLDHTLNSKHGRALQLAIWGLDEAGLAGLGEGRSALFVVEQTATKPEQRPAWQRHWCERLRLGAPAEALTLYRGRKRFLLYRTELGAQPTERCPRPALARFYGVQPGQVIERRSVLRGWAVKDGAGVGRIGITLDARTLAVARYGLPAPHVQQRLPASDDPAHPDVGFEADLDLSALPPGRYRLGIRVWSQGGSEDEGEEAFEVPVELH